MILLMELVVETKIEEFLASKVMCRHGLNSYIWKLNKDGQFSMALAWEVTRIKGEPYRWIKWIWYKILPKRISICM